MANLKPPKATAERKAWVASLVSGQTVGVEDERGNVSLDSVLSCGDRIWLHRHRRDISPTGRVLSDNFNGSLPTWIVDPDDAFQARLQLRADVDGLRKRLSSNLFALGNALSRMTREEADALRAILDRLEKP